MAISKRTRYEVLRRDNFTCRYCGAKAPDVVLHVDHVIPVALGGSDKPENLVTACADCNSGKGSTSPDEKSVAQVSDDAMRWALAMKEASRREDERTDAEESYIDGFYVSWTSFTIAGTDRTLPLSSNWEAIVLGYVRSGLSAPGLLSAVEAAMGRKGIEPGSRFQYFCGIVRNKLQALNEVAAQLIESGEV